MAGEAVVGEDGEGGDAVGGSVAFDAVPMAAVGLRVPGGEDVGVVEGLFDVEESFLVVLVAEFCNRNGDEDGEEEEAWEVEIGSHGFE